MRCGGVLNDRFIVNFLENVKKSKVLPEPYGPSGGADLRFHSPQPDTSLRCQTTDTGLVHRAVSVYSPAEAGTNLYCFVNRGTRV